MPTFSGKRRICSPLCPAMLSQSRFLSCSGRTGSLRRRLVRTMGRRLGVELTRSQTEAVLSLKSGGFLDLPGGLCAVRKQKLLTLQKLPPLPPPMVLHEGVQDWGPWRVTVERTAAPVEESPCRITLRDSDRELSIAAWEGAGRLAVENGSRSVKRLFADASIPVERRGEHPAVLLDGKIAAVFGIAVDWSWRAEQGGVRRVVSIARR